MSPTPFPQIQQHVVNKLQAKLPQQLTYHSLRHTLDVVEQAENIALAEGIMCPHELLTLKVAALYHDAGFIDTYHDHEDHGCKIATQELPGFGFTKHQIEKVCSLIKATRIPQNPQSHLEQILCDADLDYLGREDFEQIANNLYKELLAYNILKAEEEWDALQVQFLEKHSYFTGYSIKKREKKKQAYLEMLKSKVNQTL